MKTISISYALVWQLEDTPEYKWSECGKCFNTKTNRELRQVYNSRCLGYNIKGKFRSLKQIRKQLVKLEDVSCPFKIIIMKKYKDWDLLERLPKGWKIDKTVGSPLFGYEFCTNGKSVLYGQKRALVRVIRKKTPRIEYGKIEIKKKKEIIDPNYKFPAKTVNNLARKKFQEQLLKEIMLDLMVCEIEGWDKKEYIREIKNLINSIDISNKRKPLDIKQPSLFDDLKDRHP